MVGQQFRILSVDRLRDMVRITIKGGTINLMPHEVPESLTNYTCADYVLIEEWLSAADCDNVVAVHYRFKRV